MNLPACAEKIICESHQIEDLNGARKDRNGPGRHWPIALLVDDAALNTVTRKFMCHDQTDRSGADD